MRSPAPLPLTLTPQWSCLLPLCLEALPTSRLATRNQVRGQMGNGRGRVGRKTGDAGRGAEDEQPCLYLLPQSDV